MGKTLYAVSTGSGDEYSIHAIFSTRKLAETYAGKLTHREKDIEEYELDPLAAVLKKGYMHYWVGAWPHRASNESDACEILREIRPPLEEDSSDGRWLTMIVRAKDKQHALKIANEKRLVWVGAGIKAIGGETMNERMARLASQREEEGK